MRAKRAGAQLTSEGEACAKAVPSALRNTSRAIRSQTIRVCSRHRCNVPIVECPNRIQIHVRGPLLL